MTDFKKQLQELIERAADEKTIFTGDEEVFKQGCEFLMPVLMKAIEHRNNMITEYHQYDMVSDYESNLCDKELLNILKGQR